MSSSNFIPRGDSGYIAEALMKDSLSDHDRKCIMVLKTVDDKDFSLEEALQVYDLSLADFEGYVARRLIGQIESSISFFSSKKIMAMLAVHLLSGTYSKFLGSIDKDAKMMEAHFNQLSRQIEADQLSIS